MYRCLQNVKSKYSSKLYFGTVMLNIVQKEDLCPASALIDPALESIYIYFRATSNRLWSFQLLVRYRLLGIRKICCNVAYNFEIIRLELYWLVRASSTFSNFLYYSWLRRGKQIYHTLLRFWEPEKKGSFLWIELRPDFS